MGQALRPDIGAAGFEAVGRLVQLLTVIGLHGLVDRFIPWLDGFLTRRREHVAPVLPAPDPVVHQPRRELIAV